MSDSFLAAVDARSAEVSSAVSSSAGPHVWLLSDVHAEYKENFAWIRGLAEQDRFKDDVLILAGDIAADLDIIREVFEVMLSGFAAVFFAPGNHDLWTKAKPATPRMPAFNRQHWSETNPASRPASPARQSSLDKLSEIAALCEELGVHMQPAYAGGAIVAPILSWYHASWDTEPDVAGWEGIPPASAVMTDFYRCKWPHPLSPEDESIARRFDELNDDEPSDPLADFAAAAAAGVGGWVRSLLPAAGGEEGSGSERGGGGTPRRKTLEGEVASLRAAHPSAPLITASHFVPRVELCPEKRCILLQGLQP